MYGNAGAGGMLFQKVMMNISFCHIRVIMKMFWPGLEACILPILVRRMGNLKVRAALEYDLGLYSTAVTVKKLIQSNSRRRSIVKSQDI